MAGKSVSFNTHCNLCDSYLESLAKWLSCNGEVWGVGPTAVFASAAALFLYNELEATVFIAGDHVQVSILEKTLVSTMVLGMLSLMVHLWVCSMRFFQYYLDILIRDSPNMLLEMTTAGLLGNQGELAALGPLTKFLRQQQPQIHITVCWFLSLCYADYVRKHYCTRFNMPYLEQWQTELHEQATRSVNRTLERVNSIVGSVHRRLRGYGQISQPPRVDADTESPARTYKKVSSADVSKTTSKVSWDDVGCGGGLSDAALSKCEDEHSIRIVSRQSEASLDPIEKLRAFIAASRCTCRSPNASLIPIESGLKKKSRES